MSTNRVDNTVKNMVAQAAKLSELIDYQNGSIVSKGIIRSEKGTVTILALDKGQVLSGHIAPFDALVYNFSGEAEVVIKGKPHLFKDGGVIMMPANRPHVIKAMERFKMLLVMVRS